MKIGSFNVALLNVPSKASTPFANERFLALKDYLIKNPFDILALQEIYSHAQKKELINHLRHSYPYTFFHEKNSFKWLPSDLLVLSKKPFKKAHYIPFKKSALEEKLFADKGFIAISFQEFNLVTTHLSVGGLSHPEGARATSIRAQQINEIFNYLESDNIFESIILGDFNCGPNVSPKNYELFLEKNFINTLDPDVVTWDPKNPLNKKAYHHNSPAQQVDTIFISQKLKEKYPIYQATLFANESIVSISGKNYPLSDHAGVSIVF